MFPTDLNGLTERRADQPCDSAAASWLHFFPELSRRSLRIASVKNQKDDSMRLALFGLALAIVASAVRAQQLAPPAIAPLTFNEALRQAEAASTLLRTRQGQLAIAEGLRREAASPLFNNP